MNETSESVSVVASCLIKKDDKYLLVQEKTPEIYGLWSLPGGHVDKNEALEAAARREAKEETGYDVELIKEIALYHETVSESVKHIFSANIVGGELTVKEDEILDVKWLTFDQVKILHEDSKLRRPWVWEVIQKDRLEVG